MIKNRINKSELNIRIISALNNISIEEIQGNILIDSIRENLFELKEIKSKSEFKKYLESRFPKGKKIEQINFLKEIVAAITKIFKARPIIKTAQQEAEDWQKEEDDFWDYYADSRY